ncbi:MAG: class I SAM-dependent methyltransferase [Syntrophales bacterium LBB04]|nr:class I SAM-dependent methyltransferase [Syntrophales bacterium LBB04]
MSRVFGYDRGPQSVARYYIDKFIAEHSADIRGHVLEIGDRTYTERLGSDRVKQSDVLSVWPDNPGATIVADLTKADAIASDSFDCVILTQTLQCIYDSRGALKHITRILKPGGALLATMSGISQIARYDMDRWGEFWRFTTVSAQRLFEEFFPSDCLETKAHGNVLAAMALLYGLSSRELRQNELDFRDRDYEVIITVRAVKPTSTQV